MSRISKTTASVYQGISQQSPNLQIDGQVTNAENCAMSVSRGLEKRAGCEVLNTSVTPLELTTKIHRIDRDLEERYLMTIENQKVRVFDTEGVEYVVDNSNIPYLATTNAAKDISLSTIADYTVIANKLIQPVLASDLTASQQQVAYLWYKQDTISFRNFATIEGDDTTYSGGNVSLGDVVASTASIRDRINTLSGGVYSATHIEGTGVIRVIKTDGSDFTSIEASSTGGAQFAATFLSTGGLKEDIPPVGIDGDIIRITAYENSETAYYLKYEEAGRKWTEDRAPNSQYKFDASTMPHIITREPDGLGGIKFVVAEATWEDRLVGDLDSVPNRSILDFPIEDVFFYKGRLGFLAGDSVTMSVIKDYFNLYPTSVTEVLDDDPIDVTVSSNSVVTLLHASPFPDSLIIFGQTQQFSMHSGSRSFTPENVIVDETTSYNVDDVAVPVKIGNSVFFSVPKNVYSSFREMMVEDDTLLKQAPDRAGHTPRLIPRDLQQIIPSESLDWIFLVSEGGTEMINYRFFWQGNQLAQASWSKWNFKDDWFNPIGGVAFDGVLYMIGNDSEGSTLMSFELENLEDVGLGLHLDRQIKLSDVYSDLGTLTVVMTSNSLAQLYLDNLAYLIDSNDGRRYVASAVNGNELTFVGDDDVLALPDSVNTVPNPLDVSERYTLGIPFDFKVELSEWNMKDQDKYIGDAKLFFSHMKLDCENTGDLSVSSIPKNRTTGNSASARNAFGKELGAWNGSEYITDAGTFRFLVQSRAEGLRVFIEGSNELPIRITAITKNGDVISRRQVV